ncbi:MAG: triple tyrosine motif-containing protein [Bacteroidales bacterium]
MLRKTVVLLMAILLSCSFAWAVIRQPGTPYIRNFAKSDYQAAAQNWDVAQDTRGFIYFANNDGLLVFDGVRWQLYRIPNFSMARSVYIDHRGDIYVGAYNDIGRMAWSPNGKMTFSSLKDLIPEEYRNFDDVWNIFSYRDKVVFQSYNAAYFYREGSPVTVVAAPSRFQSAFQVWDRLIFNDLENGLMEFNGSRLTPMEGCRELTGSDISSILPYGSDNGVIICTRSNGLFIYDWKKLRKWDIPVSSTLIRDQVYSATMLQEHYYALGTVLNGLVIIDAEGNLVQSVNRKKGLQNNTVLNVFPDRAGNLWLALDNGIDYLTVNSPLTFIRNSDGFGAGYATVIHDGRIYLGTNQGLYVKEWGSGDSEEDYHLIPGTSRQVWYLGVHKGVLLCGHDRGTFIISGDKAELISNIAGGWKFQELRNHPGYLIGGTYNGIILFRWQDGTWKFVRRVEGFSESFRIFEEDEQGDIWMSHGFKGIFRVRLSSDLDSVTGYSFYNSKNGLPSDYYLSLFKIKGRLIVVSETEVYEYSPSDDIFVRSVYFNQLLSPVVAISFIKEDEEGNIWYVSRNRTGVFRLREDYTYEHVTVPFLLLAGKFIHGFESIYTWSPDHIFFGTEDGFAHYSPYTLNKGYQEFSAYITRAEALHQDSVFYYGRGQGHSSTGNAPFIFEYKNNNIRFSFTAPVYDNAGNIEYSWMLEGFDNHWSEWSRSFTREYTNLPDGKYTFHVKAMNQLGIESLPDSLDFTIARPWYKSLKACLAYFVSCLSLILLTIWFVNRRIERSRIRERLNNQRIYEAREQEYNRQALEADKEIIRIRNEKLHAEMIQRDKELANQAMNMVRRNEFLISLKDELNRLKISCNDEMTGRRILDIISGINREVDNNRQREVFENAFDEVHEEFLNRLKLKYPSLTPTELRLCAFLKMNISTKEIAPLMNISVRGVEICRYRIRKKMGIKRETNLTSLLINI